MKAGRDAYFVPPKSAISNRRALTLMIDILGSPLRLTVHMVLPKLTASCEVVIRLQRLVGK